MKPLLSIVIPTYNKVSFIEATLYSVIEQTLTEIEVILVDDGSNDGTFRLLEQFCARDERLVLLRGSKNKGANFCRNKGLGAAQGEFIIFLDADDLLAPHCCASRVQYMRAHPFLDFAVFTLRVFHSRVGDSEHKWSPATKTPLEDFLRHRLPWQTMQPIWRTGFVRRIGGFDETFERMQDVEMHTRALLHRPQFAQVLAEPDCYFRIDESRRSFSPEVLMRRWVRSALLYIDKFYHQLSDKQRQLLRGTVYETLLNLNFYLKKMELDRKVYDELYRSLHDAGCMNEMSRSLLRVAAAYNRGLFRIPGINKVLKELVVRV